MYQCVSVSVSVVVCQCVSVLVCHCAAFYVVCVEVIRHMVAPTSSVPVCQCQFVSTCVYNLMFNAKIGPVNTIVLSVLSMYYFFGQRNTPVLLFPD